MESTTKTCAYLALKGRIAYSILFASLLLGGCTNEEAKIGIAKLVGFKVEDLRTQVASGEIHHSTFTAKHNGALWTYIKVNNKTPIEASLMSESEYQNLKPRKAHNIKLKHKETAEELITATVEAGKKYHILIKPNLTSNSNADITLQSYFLSDK